MNPTFTHPAPGLSDSPPPPPFHPGSGPCGLTALEWHGVLVFVMLREHQNLAYFGVIWGLPL